MKINNWTTFQKLLCDNCIHAYVCKYKKIYTLKTQKAPDHIKCEYYLKDNDND